MFMQHTFVSRGPFFGVLYRLASSRRTRALHSQARTSNDEC